MIPREPGRWGGRGRIHSPGLGREPPWETGPGQPEAIQGLLAGTVAFPSAHHCQGPAGHCEKGRGQDGNPSPLNISCILVFNVSVLDHQPPL